MTPRHRAVEFKRFLDRIDQAMPAGLDVTIRSQTRWSPARHPFPTTTRRIEPVANRRCACQAIR
jgi:hypothetical protein